MAKSPASTMKLSGYFDKEHPFPRVPEMLESVKKIYAGDPPISATWIWNPFVAMSRAFYSLGDEAEELRATLYEQGAQIVNCAVDCAVALKRADGGFASSRKGAAKRQQGYLFGYGFDYESDLDGTLIAGCRLRNTIHSVFGVDAPGGYYKHREAEFWERCKNKAPIVKTLEKPDEPWEPIKKK